MADTDDTGGIDPSTVGGLFNLRDPDLLVNVGLGLMSAAKYGGNVGDGLSQALQGYQQQKTNRINQALGVQQLGMNQLQMRMLMARMPALDAYYKQMGSMFGQGQQPAQSQQGGAPAAPSAGQQIGVTPASAGTPATPPAAPSTAPPTAGGAPGLDPMALMRMGAFGSMAGAPGAQQLLDYGKTLAQYSPGLATQMGVAKDPLTVDQALMAQARDPQDYLSAYTKYLTDANRLHVAGFSGNVTGFGLPPGILASMSNYNPSTGKFTANGQQNLIPGAAATEQALEAARARGEAAGEVVPVMDPKTHQTYYVPRSALVGAPGSASAAGAGAPSGAARPSAIAGMSPGQREFTEKRGEEGGAYLSELAGHADSAVTANYAIDQMVADARGASLGPGAGARAFVESNLAKLGQQLGIPAPKELASYQELDKYGNQLGMAQARAMGSREAAQIVQLAIRSNPNKELTPAAFGNIAQSMRALNSYVIAKNSALQGVSGSDQSTVQQAVATWNSKIDPRVWDLSLGPDLAAKFAPQIGVPRIATAMPVMASDDAASVIRNLPASMRAKVLAGVPTQVKQELLAAMQQQGAQ